MPAERAIGATGIKSAHRHLGCLISRMEDYPHLYGVIGLFPGTPALDLPLLFARPSLSIPMRGSASGLPITSLFFDTTLHKCYFESGTDTAISRVEPFVPHGMVARHLTGCS